jgi:poly(A) polymerase
VEIKGLKKSKVLEAVHRLGRERKEEVYLVGGAIRDLLLGNPMGKDFDFVAGGEAGGLAKAVAQEVGGTAFLLDEDFHTWRVIIKKGKKKTELDFSPMQGKDIWGDLKSRDFTANSIAVNLNDVFQPGGPRFIDPLNGLNDIQKKVLRANSEEALRQDPLRMLRAYRFVSTLPFQVEKDTLGMIRRNKKLIVRSAWERIRSEFFTGLDENQTGHFLRQLNEAGLLSEIFPEIQGWEDLTWGLTDHASLLEHALGTEEAAEILLSHLEDLYPSLGRSLDHHLSQTVEEGVSRRALFKFVAFFHDSGKPKTMMGEKGISIPRFLDHDQEGQKVNTAIARRMKLSRRSIRIISELTRQHMRLRSLSRGKEITPRAKYRFFHDLGKEGIESVLLALSNAMASKAAEFHWPLPADSPPDLLRIKEAGEELLRYYWGEFTQKRPKPLLNGREVMEALKIPRGKAVGGLLRKLREAEAAGRIQTREEALEFLKNIDKSAQFG